MTPTIINWLSNITTRDNRGVTAAAKRHCTQFSAPSTKPATLKHHESHEVPPWLLHVKEFCVGMLCVCVKECVWKSSVWQNCVSVWQCCACVWLKIVCERVLCECLTNWESVCVQRYNKRVNIHDAGGCRECHSSAANEDGYDILWYGLGTPSQV